MIIHLIADPYGKIFGVYKNRKLIKQRHPMNAEDILTALGIENFLIVFDEADMREAVTLPADLDEIEITGLLNERATLASIKAAAETKPELITHASDNSDDRCDKLCKCSVCGLVRMPSFSFDFYGEPGRPLVCERCFRKRNGIAGPPKIYPPQPPNGSHFHVCPNCKTSFTHHQECAADFMMLCLNCPAERGKTS